VQNILMD